MAPAGLVSSKCRYTVSVGTACMGCARKFPLQVSQSAVHLWPIEIMDEAFGVTVVLLMMMEREEWGCGEYRPLPGMSPRFLKTDLRMAGSANYVVSHTSSEIT